MLNNLIDSYFSTLNYFADTSSEEKRCGYMADWLWKIGMENNEWDIEMDILNKTFDQKSFEVKALLFPMDKLLTIVNKCLVDAGVENDFVKELKFLIQLRRSRDIPTVICTAELVGANEKIYNSKEFTTIAYDLKNLMSKKRKS